MVVYTESCVGNLYYPTETPSYWWLLRKGEENSVPISSQIIVQILTKELVARRQFCSYVKSQWSLRITWKSKVSHGHLESKPSLTIPI